MPKSEKPDSEKNRFSARAARYARVGANVGGVAARYAGRRILGGTPNRAGEASALASALGNLKGPLMKVAQLMATIPDLLPPEYAAELAKLQSEAPPMGWAFVKRRMKAELGPDWQQKFASFEHHPAAAASLGQVHRARSLDGAAWPASCNIPTCSRRSKPICSNCSGCSRSAVASTPRSTPARSARRSARACARSSTIAAKPSTSRFTALMLEGSDIVRVPRAWPELSTGRLLTLDWLEGTRMLAHKNDPLAVRNTLATAMFTAWWYPFSRYGVIHGDPHLGNYTVFEAARSRRMRTGRHQPARLRLHPHLPAAIRRRRGRSLSRAPARRRRAGRARLRDLGFPPACRAN